MNTACSDVLREISRFLGWSEFRCLLACKNSRLNAILFPLVHSIKFKDWKSDLFNPPYDLSCFPNLKNFSFEGMCIGHSFMERLRKTNPGITTLKINTIYPALHEVLPPSLTKLEISKPYCYCEADCECNIFYHNLPLSLTDLYISWTDPTWNVPVMELDLAYLVNLKRLSAYYPAKLKAVPPSLEYIMTDCFSLIGDVLKNSDGLIETYIDSCNDEDPIILPKNIEYLDIWFADWEEIKHLSSLKKLVAYTIYLPEDADLEKVLPSLTEIHITSGTKYPELEKFKKIKLIYD